MMYFVMILGRYKQHKGGGGLLESEFGRSLVILKVDRLLEVK